MSKDTSGEPPTTDSEEPAAGLRNESKNWWGRARPVWVLRRVWAGICFRLRFVDGLFRLADWLVVVATSLLTYSFVVHKDDAKAADGISFVWGIMIASVTQSVALVIGLKGRGPDDTYWQVYAWIALLLAGALVFVLRASKERDAMKKRIHFYNRPTLLFTRWCLVALCGVSGFTAYYATAGELPGQEAVREFQINDVEWYGFQKNGFAKLDDPIVRSGLQVDFRLTNDTERGRVGRSVTLVLEARDEFKSGMRHVRSELYRYEDFEWTRVKADSGIWVYNRPDSGLRDGVHVVDIDGLKRSGEYLVRFLFVPSDDETNVGRPFCDALDNEALGKGDQDVGLLGEKTIEWETARDRAIRSLTLTSVPAE